MSEADERLARIGKLAAELCYADRCPADSICVGSCAAVCPEDRFLIAASRQVFDDYWAQLLSRRPSEGNQPMSETHWQPHLGGPCPVPEDCPVEIETRSGERTKWERAGAVVWQYGTFIPEAGCTMPAECEVVAYRRTQPARELAPVEQDDDEPEAWAVEAERAASEAYAQHMGDPDGKDDWRAGKRAAALAIQQAARLSTLPAQAINAELVELREEVERLRSERRCLVSHGTGGHTDGDGLSLNQCSVEITRFRNTLYQAGREDERTALSRAHEVTCRVDVEATE